MQGSRAEEARVFYLPNDRDRGNPREAKDSEVKSERSERGKGECPEALKNLNFFQKKLKKGVDKGVQVWYSMQARSNGGAERGPE